MGDWGVAGIAQWQLTKDRGSNALNKDVKDQVYGVGPELGLICLPWEAQFKVRWIHEFEVEERFEGDFLTFTATFSL
ncbi:MAG: transporter [Candidatus Hydrogenedentota bacterium]|nr:MAG: transporter [Candidatus Hydrogenedentota bacterium]